MTLSNGVCKACGRSIDASAKLCPYCGADPATGERPVDTQALLQEMFHAKELSTTENVLEFARQRQGIVIAVSIFVAFLVLAGLHQFVTMRNANVQTAAAAVPLTEITDVANQKSEVTPVPMPDLDFPYDGRPQTMRTFIVERGAVAPAPPAPVAPAPAPPKPAPAPAR
ncbi:MAG TPA: zinc ribbon domain-containing protein [Thermoanaerobaculia bacterium]|nr:zinc ribbon domain-containing protein [Thermoanaerobaculia bacterium]